MMTDNTPKKAVISKKWLYGSLAVAALLIGIFLDNNAVAGQNNLVANSVEPVTVEKVIVKQATIDNQYYEDVDKNTESTSDTETDDSESYEDDMED